MTLKRTPPKTPEDGNGIDPCNKFCIKLAFLPLSLLALGFGSLLYVFMWCMSCLFYIFCLADYYRACVFARLLFSACVLLASRSCALSHPMQLQKGRVRMGQAARRLWEILR